MRFSWLMPAFFLASLVVSITFHKEKRDDFLTPIPQTVIDSEDDSLIESMDDFDFDDRSSRITPLESDFTEDENMNILEFDKKKNRRDNLPSTSVSSTSKDVLISQTYDQISISGGRAGNADKEAAAVFSAIDSKNLPGVSISDLRIIKNTQNITHAAEEEAIDPAIESATGIEAQALQNGKIKNKVLMNTASVMALKIEQAQSSKNTDKLDAAMVELDKNIQIDKQHAGEPSLAVGFAAST